MTYQQALEQVQTAMGIGEETFYLAQSFAKTNDTNQAIQILAEQFHQAAKSVADFDMTVIEYVTALLDDMEHLKDADDFTDSADAEYNGFFWVDDFSKYLKLNF